MTHPQSLYRIGRGKPQPEQHTASKPNGQWWAANAGKKAGCNDKSLRHDLVAVPPDNPYGSH